MDSNMELGDGCSVEAVVPYLVDQMAWVTELLGISYPEVSFFVVF